MIPMKADELAVLVRARDILADKALRPETGGGLALGIHDGLMLILRISYVDAEVQDAPAPMMMPPNPLLPPTDSDVSPAPDDGVLKPPPIWGKPFIPQHPTQPTVETKPQGEHQVSAGTAEQNCGPAGDPRTDVGDLGDDPDGDIAGYDGAFTKEPESQ